MGIYRSDGITESGQIVCTGNKDILYTTVSQAVEHSRPVPGAFVFTNPHTQYILLAIQIDPNSDIYSLLNDPSFAAHMVVDGIQKNNGVDTFQQSLLAFLGFFQHFVDDPADGAFGNLYSVYIFDVFVDIVAGHPFGIHGDDLSFNVFADAGLVLFQDLRIELAFSIPGHSDFCISETGFQRFLAIAIPAVFGILLGLVVTFISQTFIQFASQTVLHELSDGLSVQFFDVFHAADIQCLQHLRDLFSPGHFLRASIQLPSHE